MEQPSPEDDPETIAAYLEYVIRLGYNAINEKDYTFASPVGLLIRHHTSQNARLYLDDLSAEGRTLDQHLAMFAEWAQNQPKPPYYAPKSVTAQVDKDKKSARVYTQTVMHQVGDGCEVTAYVEHSWRLENDKVYRVWRYRRMRSPPDASNVGI